MVVEQAGQPEQRELLPRVRRDAVAARLVPREGRPVEQQHPAAGVELAGPQRGGRARRPGADDHQIPDVVHIYRPYVEKRSVVGQDFTELAAVWRRESMSP